MCRRSAQLGYRFDKAMTNGLWFRDSRQLTDVLGKLERTGFSGKLGLSADQFHGLEIEPLAEFRRTARQVFKRDNLISLS